MDQNEVSRTTLDHPDCPQVIFNTVEKYLKSKNWQLSGYSPGWRIYKKGGSSIQIPLEINDLNERYQILLTIIQKLSSIERRCNLAIVNELSRHSQEKIFKENSYELGKPSFRSGR